MKKIMKPIYGGLYIGLATAISLYTSAVLNPIIGALIFPTGLFLVFSTNASLITSYSCGVRESTDLKNILFGYVCTILGNLIGTIIAVTLAYPKVSEYIPVINSWTVNDFLLSFYCTWCIGIAAMFFKEYIRPIGIIGFWSVMTTMILIGFKHSVVYMFYFWTNWCNGNISWTDTLPYIAILCCNIFGGVTFAAFKKTIKIDG